MKNLIIACTCTMLAAVAFGQEAEKPAPAKAPRARVREVSPEQRAKIIAHRMRQNGGFLSIDGKGHLAILNAQTQLGESDVTNVVAKFTSFVRGADVRFLPASFTIATAKQEREKSGAGAAVFLVDDPALPMSLVAIEEGWGMVNVAPLKADNPAHEKFATRFNKELVRITSMVFSGCKSQYMTSPLQSVTSVAQLDKTMGENYGIDTVQAIVKHLPEIGVECAKRITYREACQRGIAPQPTNEFQKAIWDQIHELPSEPITIKKK